jgi:hypothetical protein
MTKQCIIHPHTAATRTTIEVQNEEGSVVLGLLINACNRRPMSLDEIERAMEKSAEDSLRRLYTGGLIHRLDRFVWASRAAVMADEIHE